MNGIELAEIDAGVFSQTPEEEALDLRKAVAIEQLIVMLV